MKIAGILVRRRVFVSTGLVIAATGFWLFWSRATLPKANPIQASQSDSFVRIVAAGQGDHDKLLEERAEFLDPTPLFLPTSKNFQQGPLPSRVIKQPGQVFRDFEPKWHFVATTLPEYGETSDSDAGSLPEMLARGNDAPFAGLGRIDQSSLPLASRKGFIEVKALKSGILSVSGVLEGLNLPEIDFNPVEFMVSVASEGLVGDPVMVATSGQDEIDGKLKDYLVKVYRIGERLAPGRYMVLIGP